MLDSNRFTERVGCVCQEENVRILLDVNCKNRSTGIQQDILETLKNKTGKYDIFDWNLIENVLDNNHNCTKYGFKTLVRVVPNMNNGSFELITNAPVV